MAPSPAQAASIPACSSRGLCLCHLSSDLSEMGQKEEEEEDEKDIWIFIAYEAARLPSKIREICSAVPNKHDRAKFEDRGQCWCARRASLFLQRLHQPDLHLCCRSSIYISGSTWRVPHTTRGLEKEGKNSPTSVIDSPIESYRICTCRILSSEFNLKHQKVLSFVRT